jgi:hypothetical protein
MTFRQQVYLRLVLTFAAAAALTGFALNLIANAQSASRDTPLFVLTEQAVYAVYPAQDRHVALDIPGKLWNMVLSPDGTTLLLDSQPDGATPSRNFYTVDVETLEIRQLPLRDAGAEVSGMPVWRWDSSALLYTEYDADRVARVVEYTLESDQRSMRAYDMLNGGNLGTSGVPLVIFWSPEAFALLHYDDDRKAYLLRYDSSGTALTPIMLFDPADPDSLYFDNFVHVAGEDRSLLAMRRPEIKQWDVIDVLSGEITRLEEGIQVVKAPVGLHNPRFVMIIDDAILFPAIHNLAALINGQRGIFLPEPKSVLTISPDGEYFAVADADGFDLSNGDFRSRIALPQDDWMLTWRVAWAPLEGRIERIGRFRLDSAAGRFLQGRDGLLVLLDTPTGELPVAYTSDVRLAPDDSSIVWVSRGANNEAQVMRYDWHTNEKTLLFWTEETDAILPLPVIVDYDGEIVTLDGEEGRFTVDLDGNLTRIEGEDPDGN